jgi:hypothetical protein
MDPTSAGRQAEQRRTQNERQAGRSSAVAAKALLIGLSADAPARRVRPSGCASAARELLMGLVGAQAQRPSRSVLELFVASRISVPQA